MKETPFGAVLANVMSVGARGLGWRLIVLWLGAGTVVRVEVSRRSR